MVPDSLAYICDAGVLAVVSTVVTVCYLLIRLAAWISDSFYALPNKTKGLQVATVSSRNLYSQATTQGNKGDPESKPTNSGQHQTTSSNGSSEEQQEEGTKAKYTQQSSDTSGVQRLTVPGKWTHNVLHPIEHNSWFEGVSPPRKHQEGLCQTWSQDSRSSASCTDHNEHFNTSAVSRTGETGSNP